MALISYKYKFIFIHNPKVAGRSVRLALGKYGNTSRIGKGLHYLSENFNLQIGENNRYLPKQFYWPPRHITTRDLKTLISEETFNFHKFAFVRNPWDWHVSMYHFMNTSVNHPRHLEVKNLKNFEEFLEWWINNGVQYQKDYVTDLEGKLNVDFIGRFETIEKDFRIICDQLGISATLPHINKSDHTDYLKYYNPRTIAMVKFHLGEDIEFFKYRFEERKY